MSWYYSFVLKEAHGGTSIGAFLSTMLNSAMVLQGPPRPAFYDGLMVQSTKPDVIPELVDGWRTSVSTDGTSILPAECFVACNQFFVPPEHASAFEQRWSSRESRLKECEGFVAFSMMRRDGQQKGHGTVPIQEGEPNYLSTTIWKNRASFDQWRTSQNFQEAHGQQTNKKDPVNKETAVDKDGTDGAVQAAKAPPLWSRPPQPVFYEGTLVITKEEGA
jgi:heme-degrading monooxygenase HmoA